MRILRYRLLETSQTDGGAGGGEQQQSETNQQQGGEEQIEVEKKARQMGWKPKNQWVGNPESWIDAQEFVRRGETFVPFLQAERRRMTGELDQLRQQNASIQSQLVETQTQLREITEFNRQMATDRDTRRKSELGSAIRAEEDPVRRAEMETELRQITDRESQRNQNQNQNRQQPPQNNQQQPPVQIQPWVRDYLNNNADFFKDADKATLFNSKMLQRRQAGDQRVGEVAGVELFNEVMEEVNARFGGGGNQRRQAPSRTEDSRPNSSGSGSRSGQKTYFDLPADAQQKCDQQESRFVGDKKLFKNQEQWRRHYVTEYFRQ